MASEHEEKNATNGELREGANVDKIRDILFGSNMREYEKRFARLEEKLTKSSEALRDDLKKRFDSFIRLHLADQLRAGPVAAAPLVQNVEKSRGSFGNRGRFRLLQWISLLVRTNPDIAKAKGGFLRLAGALALLLTDLLTGGLHLWTAAERQFRRLPIEVSGGR